MNHNILEYYQEQIEHHQAEHLASDYRAVEVIQALASDLSCTICYPPRRVSSRLPFGRFWYWYRRAYQVETHTRITQESFLTLAYTNNPDEARTKARDIVFSCRYQHNDYSPREIILNLIT